MSIDLLKWIKSPGPLYPIYFVTGKDVFFISEIKKTLIKHALSQEMNDFNFDELSANETKVGDLLSRLETLPFMSKKRLVFFNQSEKLKENDWKQLSSFLSQPSNHAVVSFFFDKKDARKKHFKLLQKKGLGLLAESPKEWNLSPWIDFLAQKEEVAFMPSARALFTDLVGANLMEMQMEMKKLKQYIGEETKISEQDVIHCVSHLKTQSVFHLADAIGKKDTVQALNCLIKLLEQNQNELGALAVLARHIRILSRLKEGEDQKLNKTQLARFAGISPYFLNNYLNQAHAQTLQQIQMIAKALLETDKALKSSPLSAGVYLKSFILKVCS